MARTMLKRLLCFPACAIASNAFGAKFLEENRAKEGVITLPTGLQYKVLRAGNGTDHPALDSPCSCHYEGRTAENYPNGKKFDSSYDRGKPAVFKPKQVIKGWTIAMQLMVEGDKWELYIPSDLAYGSRHKSSIPGGSVLVFTMEIIKIIGNTKLSSAMSPNRVNRHVNYTQLTLSSNRVNCTVANLVGDPPEGSFLLEVHPNWAPIGAKRLQELVAAHFFDGVRFFRVINGFMAQFGIHGDPSVMRQWATKRIKDDAKIPGISNKRGSISFAMSGPHSRSTQFFINFADNSVLDGMGFTPVAEVVEGMDVVDRIFKVGEGAPNGPGPSQDAIQAQGNAYLDKRYPRLSFVKSCRPAMPLIRDFGDGLKLLVIQSGDGKTFPHPGDKLSMHYTLRLASDASGRVIDSSRKRNQPFTFKIGRGEVIRGWDKGVMKMSLGERGVLSVPSALGYGARGAGAAIPPNADLAFDVEVLRIGNKRSPVADLQTSSGINILLVFLIVCVVLLLLLVVRHACGVASPANKGAHHTLETSIGKPASVKPAE